MVKFIDWLYRDNFLMLFDNQITWARYNNIDKNYTFVVLLKLSFIRVMKRNSFAGILQ